MKPSKLLFAMGLAMGVGMAGQAQATMFYSGTISSWSTDSPVVDADGDTQWSVLSYSSAIGGADVVLTETEFGAVDWYTVDLDFAKIGGVIDATYSLEYTGMHLVDDEWFASAHLDMTHVGEGVTVTKEIFDLDTGDLLLTLTSIDGVPDEGTYALTKNIRVLETYSAGPLGRLDSSENSFDVKGVPEPATLALVGLGLLGASVSRRRRAV